MCLILVASRAHPEFPLVVAANRDEFHKRPTEAAGFWQDRPEILAGRDLEAGGTWMEVYEGVRDTVKFDALLEREAVAFGVARKVERFVCA